MKITSLRRVLVALVVAVTAATVHGAWFASAAATTEGAPAASIRLAEWDHYEQKWVATLIGDGETLRHSEGAIFELRSQSGGAVSFSSVPAELTIETLDPQDLNALNIPLPSASNLVAFAPLTTVPVASGSPTYIRLAVSSLEVEPDHADDELQTRPLGHVGVWSGPLSPTDTDRAALDVNGSVGVHSDVELTDGSDTVTFSWDIGRWAKGDLFVGMNQYTYRVLDRTGEFKRFVASADIDEPDADLDYNVTAGCAANWLTGEVFATNFADLSPSINVITRHPSSEGRSLYSPADRRISTFAAYTGHPDAELPIDTNPESVAFDAQMNMYVGHSSSFLGPVTTDVFTALTTSHPDLYDADDDWYFLDVNGWPLSYSDGSFPVVVDETGAVLEVAPGGLGSFETRRFGIDASTRLKYNGNNLIFSPATALASLGVPALMPETYLADPKTGQPLMEQGGSEIAGRWPMGRRIHRYNVQPDGSYRGAETLEPGGPDRDVFWAATSRFGTDWIDLNVTGDVAYYTSEDSLIHRYRVRPGTNNEPVGQLPDVGFGQLLPGEDVRFNALRILPPGDGSGGFLTAGGNGIYRFAQDGTFVQMYQVHDDPYLKGLWPEGSQDWDDAGLVMTWYAMEIDPGGKSFWASSNDSGWIYQFDVATGRELRRVEAVEFLDLDVDPEQPEGRAVGSLCVMWEYTAPQEVCLAADGSPDGNDDDGDGLIDENCKAIEVCTNVVDDDGDGVDDNNDPDCGAEEPPVAEPDFYVTDQDVELTVPSAGAVVLTNDSDPDNADDAEPWRQDTVVVEAYGVSLTDHTPGTPLVTATGTVTLAADGSFVYAPAPGFHGQFTFVYSVTDGASVSAPTTVTIDVRPRVVNDTYTTQKNTPLSGSTVLANDSVAPMSVSAAGPDTISSLVGTSITFETSNDGTVVLNSNGTFEYTPALDFFGADSFVYLGYDGNSDSVSTATVTINVTDVNGVVAQNDAYVTAFRTATTQDLFLNDSDPQGDTFELTHVNGQPVTTGSVITLALPGDQSATVLVNALTGSVTITPSEDFWGDITFSYTIQDSASTPATSSAVVTVTVREPGTIAVANDEYTTFQNTPITIPASLGVLANDDNIGLPVFWVGAQLQLLGLPVTGSTAAGSTFTIWPDGRFAYTPAPGFVGVEDVLYGVRRWDGTDFRANIRLTVLPTSTVVTLTMPDPSTYGTAAEITATVTCGASQAPSAGTVTFLLGPTVIATGVPVVNGVAATELPASLAVGNYSVTAQYSGVTSESATGGCPASSDTDTHQVIRAPLTITAEPQSKPYGTAFTFAGTEFTVSGLLFDTDTVTSATLVSPTGAPASATVAGAPYPITPSSAQGTGLGNYTISYLPGPLTVTRVPLTVQAHDKTRVEGQPNPTLDGVWTGFVNGESVPAVYTTTAVPSSPVGTYPITPTPSDPTNILANYSLVIVPGTLEVTPFVNSAPIAVNDSRTTQGTTPVSITVLANDSDPDGHPLVVVPTGFTQPANGTVTLAGNVFTFVANTGFTGTTTFTYTISDGHGGTAMATVTVVVTATTCGGPAAPGVALVRTQSTFNGTLRGSVQIMQAVGVTLNSNAVITGDLMMPGTPSIVNNGSATYTSVFGTGATTPTSHQFVFNSGASLGRLVRRTDAVALPTVSAPPSPTGWRYVTMNSASDNPGNFATLRSLTLNSNVGPVTVPAGTYDTFTANHGSHFVIGVVGATTPSVYNFQQLTLNSGSSLQVVGPVIVTLKNGTSFNGPVGTAAHPSWLTLRVSNGDLTLNSNVPLHGYVEVPNGRVSINSGALLKGGLAANSLTINSGGVLELVQNTGTACPQEVVIKIDDKTKVYGNTDPALTYQIISGGPLPSGVLTGTISRVGGEAVGTYAIGQGTLAVTGAYTLEVIPGEFTITPRPATVTAGSASKTYGAADPTLSPVTTSGFSPLDLLTLVLGQTRAPGQGVGVYPTTATAVGALLGNYTVTYVPGALTITPAPLTVKAHDKTRPVGQPNPTLDGVWTGLVNGDVITANYTTTATLSSPAGSYVITPTPVDPSNRLANYALTIVPGTLTVTPPTSPCQAVTFTLNQSGGAGSAGNIRAFSSGGLNLKVSAFSREKQSSGAWAKAFLGAFDSYGLGVTDSSSGDSHTLDNSGRNNYMLFVFDTAVVVDRAFLGWVSGDSDAQIWVGNIPGAFASPVTLNDAILSSLGTSETSSGGSAARWADFNGGAVSGNVVVIAANTSQTNDMFKVAKVEVSCFTPPPPPCSATQLTFSGNSTVNGAAGNIRTFSSAGVSVNASAFSRVKGTGGSWSPAYLGVWSMGLGVTDTSENGSSDTHKLDNSGRLNYILFEFSTPVVVTKAFLDSIGADSDASFWVGTKANAFTNHVTLSDAVLASLGAEQTSDGGSTARWATFNSSKVSGNVVVIAANPSGTNDAFKVSKLEVECGADAPTSPKSDKSHKSWKSDKSSKSGKSGKSDKYSHSDKSDKSSKSDKYSHSDKSSKSSKSDKYSHSDKSSKSSKSDKYSHSDKSSKHSSKYSYYGKD